MHAASSQLKLAAYLFQAGEADVEVSHPMLCTNSLQVLQEVWQSSPLTGWDVIGDVSSCVVSRAQA